MMLSAPAGPGSDDLVQVFREGQLRTNVMTIKRLPVILVALSVAITACWGMNQVSPSELPIASQQAGGSGVGSDNAHLQGVRGRVTNTLGDPVLGAHIFLMPGRAFSVQTPTSQWASQPLVQAISGTDGVFHLGLPGPANEEDTEIHILHAKFCDYVIRDLRIQAEDWYGLGDIRLKKGGRVLGRVTTRNGEAVSGAIVTANPTESFVASPPGRKKGRVTMTDSNGNYGLFNLDPNREFVLEVAALGLARDRRSEVRVGMGKRVRIDFRLASGLAIDGILLSSTGSALSGVAVTVTEDTRNWRGALTTRTKSDGSFHFGGLGAGNYVARAETPDHSHCPSMSVRAGTSRLILRTQRRSSVLITVLDERGTPLPDYLCNLKPVSGSDYGNAVASKKVENAKDGKSVMFGSPGMRYVAEIHALGHAKSFSDSFAFSWTERASPGVTVTMNEGGVIQGTVRDSTDKPLKGVEISTKPNSFRESQFSSMFPPPYTITKRELKTGPEGEFRLDLLYPGVYQLEMRHPEFAARIKTDVLVSVGNTTTIGDIAMDRGCLLSGIATVDGVPQGQLRVHVNAIDDDRLIREVVTDSKGRFRFRQRLAVGKYTARAARHVGMSKSDISRQYVKSLRKFEVPPQRTSYVLNINIPMID
jgi:Carboxypeptidase regulatory-like domain